MSNQRLVRFTVPTLALCLGLSACGAPPYVYDADEFNRSAVDFGKDQADISEFTICYSESGTTPQTIRAMAVDECARFGKSAQFVDQDYLSCPLSTPVAAHYVCIDEQPKTGFDYYQY